MQDLNRCNTRVTADQMDPGGGWPTGAADHRHVSIRAMAARRLFVNLSTESRDLNGW